MSNNPNLAFDYFNRALSLYHEGDMLRSDALCRQSLEKNPGHALSWHLLGLIANEQGEYSTALDLFSTALRLDPGNPAYHNSAGIAHSHLGNEDRALQSFLDAIKVNPDFMPANDNLGKLLVRRGKYADAQPLLERALKAQPDSISTLYTLGIATMQQSQHADSLYYLKKAHELAPRNPDILEQYIQALKLDHQEESATAHQKSLDALLGTAKDLAHIEKARSLAQQGNFDEAITLFRKAYNDNPQNEESTITFAAALRDTSQNEEAEKILRSFLRLLPDNTNALNELATLVSGKGEYQEAEQLLQRALTLEPNNQFVTHNLGNNYNHKGDAANAVKYLSRASELSPDDPRLKHSFLLTLHYDPRVSAEDIQQAHKDFANRFTDPCEHYTTWDVESSPKRRLKIGFISPDFRANAVAFFLLGTFTKLDKKKFSLHCYSNNATTDYITDIFKSHADSWRDIVSFSSQEVARMIHDDQIDILFDLSGHVRGNRLMVFAHKPAPVQVTWIGYPNTTGLAQIDHRLVDDITDPEDRALWTSEKLLRLPNGFLNFTLPHALPAIGPAPFHRNGYITYGCFNNNAKIHAGMIRVWSDILKKDEASQFLLKNDQLRSPEIRQLIEKAFSKHGISNDRLQLVPRVNTYDDHLNVYNDVDIALDTFPYNGTTITCEALIMGVPVITLQGDRHVSRVGSSLLSRVELSDLIAIGEDNYIAKAIELANNPDLIDTYRNNLRSKFLDCPLGNANLFVRDLEAALTEAWNRYTNNGT